MQRALRQLFSGAVILLALMIVANAAAAQRTATAGTQARAEFRPLARGDDRALYSPRRPLAGAERRANAIDRRAWLPEITDGRSGARKAVPVQRGQELGLRFRPDDRDTLYDQYPPTGVTGGPADEAQQQFRPIAPKRRPTYEELEAQRRADAAAPPSQMGSPLLQPPMLPPATGPWPRW